MKTLGVHVANDVAFLAVAEDGGVLDCQPPSVRLADGLAQGDQIRALCDDVKKIASVNNVQRIAILAPEATYKGVYAKMVPRISIETVIMMAAAEISLPCRRIPRQTVRSVLGMSQRGDFAGYADVFHPAVGPSWKGKRSLAAAAAVAEGVAK